MPAEQMVERASRELQDWMKQTTERAIRDMLDQGRGLFAAAAPKPEQLAFFLNEIHKVGLIGPDGSINPQARALLVAKYGEAGYVQLLEAVNAARVQTMKDAPPLAISREIPGGS